MVIRESAENIRGWGARDTVLVSRKPFTDADIARAQAVAAAGKMQVVYIPGTTTSNEFSTFLTTPDPASFLANYRYDLTPVGDDRPFFFYTVQPRDLTAFLAGPTTSADYKINRAVPLLFGLVAISIVATAVILLLPPIVLGTRLPARARRPHVPALLRLHRHRLHSDPGCADPEIRPAARTPCLRTDGHHLLDADLQRTRELLQPSIPPWRRLKADTGSRRSRRACGLARIPRARGLAGRDWMASRTEDDHHRPSDRASGLRDGYAVPDRIVETRATPPRLGSLGLGPERRIQRTWLGQRHLPRHLPRPERNAANRGIAVRARRRGRHANSRKTQGSRTDPVVFTSYSRFVTKVTSTKKSACVVAFCLLSCEWICL